MADSTSSTSGSESIGNPMGTDGFEFVEYAAPDPQALGRLFEQLGFRAVARHRQKDVTLYRQGEVNFIINAEPGSFGQSFARIHGPSVCAIAFRVKDAVAAFRRAVELGAWGVEAHPGPMELAIPAIKGIGDSLIYLVDRYPGNAGNHSIYDVDFKPLPGYEAVWAGDAPPPEGAGTELRRSPDTQRAPRTDERVGGVLSAPVQLQGDPLLRYRRQTHRSQVASDDESVWEDPHPDQ